MENTLQEKYELVIGLEVHVQLLTKSKIFCADSTTFDAPPNTTAGVVTLGHPGTLPKLNKQVIELAIRMGLACGSDIAETQHFDRKNYFYPDLPKGYQLTQHRTPLARNGYVTIRSDGKAKRIHLEKIHLEEDAGKSIHPEFGSETLLDYNRAGVALIEIVTKPEITSAADAAAFFQEIRKLARYLEISDGNMEEGSLRCDANVSIRIKGTVAFGKRVEIKNLNSIRNLSRAIAYDSERQLREVEQGKVIVAETRTYHADDGKTYPLRMKEELNDYRYFPDPDLSPLHVSSDWLDQIRSKMPSLPSEVIELLMSNYQLSEGDAGLLADSRDVADYFQHVCSRTTSYKAAANWMIGPVRSFLREHNMEMIDFPIPPDRLAELVQLVDQGTVSFSAAAQKLFPAMIGQPGKAPDQLAVALDILQESNAEALESIVRDVIKEFPLKVEEFRNGKKGIVSMFMGEVMKRSRGKADPKKATELLEQILMKK